MRLESLLLLSLSADRSLRSDRVLDFRFEMVTGLARPSWIRRTAQKQDKAAEEPTLSGPLQFLEVLEHPLECYRVYTTWRVISRPRD
jgi:hypothetical protein